MSEIKAKLEQMQAQDGERRDTYADKYQAAIDDPTRNLNPIVARILAHGIKD
jgi:hypothetical protein